MAEPADQAPLPPDAAARLTEFARTCKAAARAVALYPAGHPAIVTSLSRVAEATARLTQNGPFAVQVHAQELLVNDARLAKADPAIAELAALLHRHLIGRLTLSAGADASSWRTLLLLLARTPEEVRADGGIAHLWETAGGPSIEIQEIDYVEVLREKKGIDATVDDIVAAAIAGGPAASADTMQAVLETVTDPEALKILLARLEQAVAESPDAVEQQTAALLTLARNLVVFLGDQGAERLAAVFADLGQGARHLSVEAMISLLAERSQPRAMAGAVNVVDEIVNGMTDSSIAGFVAHSVVTERGASERLAHAFQALVPEYDRQRRLLALAREEAVQSEADTGTFSELWERVEAIMTSYTDARYVSTEYARDLSYARTQPMDVERTSDDPAERVAAWLATVSDASLRTLDQDLLTDLLTLERDDLRWRDVAETVVTHADDFVRVGYVDQALVLIHKLMEEGGKQPGRQPHLAAALERLGRGSLLKHMPVLFRTAENETFEQLKRLCHTIGTSVIVPLAEGLAAEQDARSRRRLRDILVGFGARGAESVRPLMHAGNWEVRRTAAFLLREFGGSAGLKELVPLLSDAEPLVQREAVQALVLNGSREASAMLLTAILQGKDRARQTLLKEVLGMRDERAFPLFAHVLREIEPDRAPELYDLGIEVLGGVHSDEAVEALAAALHKGQWWAFLSNRRRRAAAAESLRRIGSPAALEALRRASVSGSAGVKAAARAALTRTG